MEALRTYTHEFTNKLHVILGLIQLGENQRAEEYILRITASRAQSIDYIRERIQDPTVAALLVGKAYRAAELDIRFTLTPPAPSTGTTPYLPAMGMITVLGNLIENAFDALLGAPPGEASEVTVSIREGQHGLVISVDDTGPGMTEEVRAHIFDKGFSTRGDSWAPACPWCRTPLAAYGGTIRVESEPGVGTSFITTLTTNPSHRRNLLCTALLSSRTIPSSPSSTASM